VVEFYFRRKDALFASYFVKYLFQEFGNQEDNTLTLSPLLKEITSRDGAAALRFLGTQRNLHMPCLTIEAFCLL
jgi:hypothetical protein